jgi:hypothetical protein
MAFGDTGGAVTELIITCKTPAEGTVAIKKGDALKLSGAYTVDNATEAEDPVFGQAMADAAVNGIAIPVKVRGISIFPYTGAAPAVNGASGILASATPGVVKAPASGNGSGLNLRVDTTLSTVHVLL